MAITHYDYIAKPPHNPEVTGSNPVPAIAYKLMKASRLRLAFVVRFGCPKRELGVYRLAGACRSS